jgi:hypothetical protein
MPEYDNDPTGDAMSDPKAKFNSDLHPDDVYGICGCDPEHYFEFIFRNVRINQVTYRDGTSVTQGDSIIGQKILLYGLMPDISPSAIEAQLFAASLKVGNLLAGRLHKAIQSDLRTNVRPLNTPNPFSAETAGAHFETILDLTDKTQPKESRFLQELGELTQLEFYMHVNRYTVWNTKLVGYPQDRLNGDVYGYIRPIMAVRDNLGIRIKGRRLIAHPDISNVSKEISNTFLGTTPLTRNTDIDCTYDILKSDRLLTMRYLDFVPQLDRDYRTPTDKDIVKEYTVFFADKQRDDHLIKVGSFKGDHSEMQRTGGLLVFQLPADVLNRDDLRLVITVENNNGKFLPLILESEWDLVLESERGITMASRNEKEIIARVYYLNRPWPNCPVRLSVQPSGEISFLTKKNTRSPIVASWKVENKELITDDNGIVKATIEAVDLENLKQEVFDPVKNRYVKGDLDWDRYYGNYVYMEIDNDLRRFQYSHVEQIEIAVRVLHALEEPKILAAENEITFKDYIFPKLFKYYVRYFPWLHTIETQDDTYRPFLNLEDYDQVSSNIFEIIRRLELNDDDWDKMPRSRDFPVGGVELVKHWLINRMPQ